jgi:hypothetical protein
MSGSWLSFNQIWSDALRQELQMARLAVKGHVHSPVGQLPVGCEAFAAKRLESRAASVAMGVFGVAINSQQRHQIG